ncbi:MAG: translocation/assembly module TamB domain-containing protein [Ignavibacteria bacterium]|nr:translocation/assembly module TamB domain-containing protein [Ignavibacteria bacterium]
MNYFDMPKSQDRKKGERLFRRAVRIAGRWLWRIGGTFLILCAFFVIISQTEFFKRWLRNTIVYIVNNELVGKLTIDGARVDIFHGIVIEHPRLYADGTLLFEAQQLSVAYDLAALANQMGSVGEIVITNPKVDILKSKAGVWNIDRVIKPITDTSETEPPDFTIAVRSLRIEDGSILVNDGTTQWSDGTTFDPQHIHLDNVNCNISVRASLRARDYAVAVNGMSFTDKFGPVDVHDLKLVARASPEGVDVQSMHLRVNKSDISLRARIDGVDITKGFEDSLLKSHPIVGHVEADSVWGPDVKFFFNDVDMLGSYALKADVKFDGNTLDVSRMDLHAGDTRLYGRTIVKNLSNNKQLTLDVSLRDSKARYADLRRRLRFVEIPELDFLSTTDLRYVYMKGAPTEKLSFVVDASDKPGDFRGELTLELNKRKLGYQMDMKVFNGNLSQITGDTLQTTNLNGRVMMVGSGTTLQDVLGTFQIELDRSRFFRRPLRTMRAIVKADGKGKITLDTLFADVTPFSDDTTLADPFQELSSQRISLSAAIDVADTTRPSYTATIGANGLDLASLFDDSRMPSRLSWQFSVEGTGIQPDSIQGWLRGRVNELMLSDRSMLPFDIELSSQRKGSYRNVSLKSDFATASITGEFIPSTLIETITLSAKSLVNVIKHRIKNIVTIDSITPVQPVNLKPIDADVSIQLFDVSPLNMFLVDVALSGSATLSGSVSVTQNLASIVLDTIYTQTVNVVSADVDIYSDPISASFEVSIDNNSIAPKVRRLKVSGTCDSTVRVGLTRVLHPRVLIDDQDGEIQIVASSWVDDMAFTVGAKANVMEDKLLLELDTASFVLDTAHNLNWELSHPSVVSIASGVLQFDGFKFERKRSETITLSGYASSENFRDFNIEVQEFFLHDVSHFVKLSEDHPLHLIGGKVDDLDVVINGSWTEPLVLLKMKASQVTYNLSLIGSLTSQLMYRQRDVTGFVVVRDEERTENVEALRLDINALPLDLALTRVEERFVPNKPIDISLTADDLALAVVEPFLPAIEHLRGKVDASITLTGTSPDEMHLGGQGRFEKAQFRASSTNMEYFANGVLHLEEEDLFLDTIRIYNKSNDMRGGMAQLGGVIHFDGFSVKSFDFSIITPGKNGVKIMNRASQVKSPDVYGDLIIATNDGGLRFYGPLDAPRLSGEVFVNYADLTLPKERSAVKARPNFVKYIRKVSDTIQRENILEYYPQFKIEYDTLSKDTTRAQTETAVKKAIVISTPSFADIIDYDLKIYLRGRVLIKMVLGTFEVLIADLEQVDYTVPLEFTGMFANNSTNLLGKVHVKEGASTYQFYKPFRTGGTLDFSAGGLTNPTLDLKAVYENRRYKQTTGSDQGTPETYKVELTITGTKQYPRLRYRLWRNEREVVDDSAQIAADALSLILFGKTQAELVSSGQGSIANQAAALSAAASSFLGDFVGGSGTIVQSASVDVGSNLSTSTLTVTGQIVSDVNYRVTSQVSDFSGNSTFTLTLPLSIVNDNKLMRLLQLDFSASVNNSGNITRQTRLWEIKFGARLP